MFSQCRTMLAQGIQGAPLAGGALARSMEAPSNPFISIEKFREAWANGDDNESRARGLRVNLSRYAPSGQRIRALLEELPVHPLPGGVSQGSLAELAAVFDLKAPAGSIAQTGICEHPRQGVSAFEEMCLVHF